ncbi:hypothetical protein VMCG_00314 [Cytospora schulzeri]|uniref:DUF1857-domain-containing protein n=1 Tax=Cytospora schulzeri TaxID=448051 RepID=A0A423X948_9PEZI|nr:hypothetical protein VMCG_00314 [Valsa malicola]
MTPANYIAYTAPINPPSAETKLTLQHIWALLRRKIIHAEDFVGGAILDTEVVSESEDDHGRPLTTRVVTFREGNRRVQEVVTTFFPMKVEFRQPNGSVVGNIISKGAEGEYYLTYTFEWMHPDMEEGPALGEKRVAEEAMAKHSVESTLEAMRAMVVDGRWKETA